TAHYITDKMPHNFIYIGMIAILLPKAKIVHCQRDPMDTCLSLYKNMFGTASHQWSYDLKDLGRYYQLYQGLMAHWHRTLPGKIYDIQYEQLVADPERQIRDLLNYCELPFDPACLSFHESDRAVRTLSFAQVRKPIYSSSVQLWKRYQHQLQSLAAQLNVSGTT
ncbi:MAG: sulfotransferase, partial [Deltaproteobacteria bacterium]